jgi:hypothetical protein
MDEIKSNFIYKQQPKPTPHGLKMIAIVDSTNGYFFAGGHSNSRFGEGEINSGSSRWKKSGKPYGYHGQRVHDFELG